MAGNIRAINKFGGYSNYQDITNMPVNMLAAGSQNVMIEDGAKLEPRAGMEYFGVAGTAGTQTNPYWTLAHRIHSKYDEFVNKQGVKIPVRVFYEGHTAKGDVMEVWLPNYVAGVAQTTKKWYQVTATSPSLPIVSTHRWYFAEWFDPTLAVLQPELIFTYGATKIGNWSGGFAPVTAVSGTTITTNGIWETKGFIWSTEGTNIITVNGVEYTVTGGFGTNTLTVASTAGISINNVVFQNVYFNDTLSSATTYDVCSIINNQVYYEDWNQRNVYISWNRNQAASVGTTIFTGVGLDDGAFSGPYTGTTHKDFKVIISSVVPNIVEQTFTGTGFNDGIFRGTGNVILPAGYSGTAGALNVYKVTIVADTTIIVPTPGTAFWPGENVIVGTVGSETAVGNVSTTIVNGSNTEIAVALLAGQFAPGDVVTGVSSGTSATIGAASPTAPPVFSQNWIQYSKNGVITSITNGPVTGTIVPVFSTGNITLTDGLIITFGTYFGHDVGDVFQLNIRTGGIDTFQWSNGGALSAPVSITGGLQTLSDGIQVKFTSINGHTIGDSWTMGATQVMVRGWSNFTYDNPNRLPGQGFTLLLDSNGWTMKPQEHTMLINSAAGHFYDVEVKLSANLLGETIVVTRLKSEPQNKVLFPYLLNYIKNQLATISNEKTFDVLGRQKFLELQQSRTISDAVRIDFATVDWQDGDVLYFKRKIYFNVPRKTAEGIGACIFVYDDYKKYWHTPQVFSKRVSLLSVIDDKLVGHSYEMNESYELFSGTSDLGVFPIQVKGIMPYDSSGNRYQEKAVSGVGFEGYIYGNPQIAWTVNAGGGGCAGQQKGIIAPQNTKNGLCLPVDKASLGKSSLGFHGLGNDVVDVIPHFFYIKNFDNMPYYQRNIEFSCALFEDRFSLISLGTTLDANNTNNITITDLN